MSYKIPVDFIEIPEKRYSGIKMNLSRATPKSRSIGILLKCAEHPKTLQEIYPSTKHPLAMEVVALAKAGFLKKLSKPKYIHSFVDNRIGEIRNTYTKVWYSTTCKGNTFAYKVMKQNKI